MSNAIRLWKKEKDPETMTRLWEAKKEISGDFSFEDGSTDLFGLPKAKFETAPSKIFELEKDTFFTKVAKILLPRNLEVKFGLTEPNIQEMMWEQEGAKQSYLRDKRFTERYQKEITENPEIPEEYKEPEGFFGQLHEAVESGYKSNIKPALGYFAESFGHEMKNPDMIKWGEEFGSKMTIEVMKHPELLRPEDMKPFFEGGYADPRWYGRVIGETSSYIATIIGSSVLGGLLGGPKGALIGAYGSVYAIEKANFYKELLGKNVPADEATVYSNVYGVISAVIENSFGISPAKIGAKIFTKPAADITTKSFKSFLKKRLPRIAVDTLILAGQEGGEEVAQKLTADLLLEYHDQEGQKVGEDLAESFAAGFFASIPYGMARVEGVKPPPIGLTIEEVGIFKGYADLTTGLLEKLRGKASVSPAFIQSTINEIKGKEGMSKAEESLVSGILAEYSKDENIPVKEFADKIKAGLLPLKGDKKEKKHESITLPDGLRGDVLKYYERIYESPIKTSAGGVHFDEKTFPNYFAHVRSEEITENGQKILRDIELQSDLFQKGGLEREISDVGKGLGYKEARTEEVFKIEPYRNTWHERIIRERIKFAAQNGYKQYRLPTGETAMKIEGIGGADEAGFRWVIEETDELLSTNNLYVGDEIVQFSENVTSEPWIITEVLEDGKFKAISRNSLDKALPEFQKDIQSFIKTGKQSEKLKKYMPQFTETFDVSGKLDTSNPVYIFYENKVKKYLEKIGKNFKQITDPQGVTWFSIDIPKKLAKEPIGVFKFVERIKLKPKPKVKPKPKAKPKVEVPKKVEPKVITQNQIDVARGFARKFVKIEITKDKLTEELKKTFPKVKEVVIEDIVDKARIFKEQDVTTEKKVADIGNYIEEQIVGKPAVLKEIEKDITKEITKKRFTLAQRLEQKTKLETKAKKEKIMALARGYREGTVTTKQNIKQIQSDLADLIDKSNLSLHDKGKFRRTIKNIQTQEQLAKQLPIIVERIKALEMAASRRFYNHKIFTDLKKTAPKKVAGKPVGKYTPEIQKNLDMFREAVKMNKKTTELALQRNLETYKDTITPDDIALQNKILTLAGNLKSKTISELRDLSVMISELADEGRMVSELKKFNREADIDQWRQKAIDIIMGGKKLPPGVVTTGIEQIKPSFKGFFKTLGKDFVGWYDIQDMLSFNVKQKETFLHEFAETLDQENANKRGDRKYQEKLRNMFTETYGLKTDREMLDKMREDTVEVSIGVFKNANGNGVDMIFSKAELRKRHAELQDPTLIDSFKIGMAYTDEIIEAIDLALTDTDKVYVDAQIIFWQEYYNTVNPIYSLMNGINLPKNPKYTPIKRGDISRDLSKGFGEFGQEIVIRGSITKGSLKSRVKNMLPIEKQSDVQVLQRHITEMEHYKAWAHKVRDLNAVFGDVSVRKAIVSQFGKGILSVVDGFIADFTRGGVETAQNMGWLDKFRGKFTRGVLSVKPSIAVKQLGSFIAYADDIPVGEFGKGEADFWKHPVRSIRILMKSDLMQSRGQYQERDIKTAMNTDAYRSFRKKPSFLNSMMLNVKLGDKAAIFVGGWAVYKYHRDAALIKDLSSEEAHKIGIRRFELTSKKAQQSADLADLSRWQRGNSAFKFFSMFGSTPNLYMRKELGAIRNLTARRISVKQFAKTIAIYHFILPMLFQWMSDFGRWDKEEQKRAAWLGSLNGWFIMGDGIEWIIRKALGMREYDMEIPIMSVFEDAGKIFKIDIDDINTEDILYAAEGLFDATGKATGLPLGYVYETLKGIGKMFSGEWIQAVGMLAGWSEYITGKRTEKKGGTPAKPKKPKAPK